jgi:hypothetical protein
MVQNDRYCEPESAATTIRLILCPAFTSSARHLRLRRMLLDGKLVAPLRPGHSLHQGYVGILDAIAAVIAKRREPAVAALSAAACAAPTAAAFMTFDPAALRATPGRRAHQPA